MNMKGSTVILFCLLAPALGRRLPKLLERRYLSGHESADTIDAFNAMNEMFKDEESNSPPTMMPISIPVAQTTAAFTPAPTEKVLASSGGGAKIEDPVTNVPTSQAIEAKNEDEESNSPPTRMPSPMPVAQTTAAFTPAPTEKVLASSGGGAKIDDPATNVPTSQAVEETFTPTANIANIFGHGVMEDPPTNAPTSQAVEAESTSMPTSPVMNVFGSGVVADAPANIPTSQAVETENTSMPTFPVLNVFGSGVVADAPTLEPTAQVQEVVTTAMPTPMPLSSSSGSGNIDDATTNFPVSFIVGGSPAAEGEFPFFVHANFNNVVCGGTLVAPDMVLTRAGCSSSFATNSDVFLGVQLGTGTSATVQETFLLDNENDVMLVKLTTSLSQDIVTLNTDTSIPVAGADVEAVGFGASSEGGSPESTLQKATLEISDTCEGIFDSQICALVTDASRDVCDGDEGGPLLIEVNNQVIQVGIYSFGEGSCGSNLPNVFKRVSFFEAFIEDTICQESDDPPTACAPSTAPSSGPTISLVPSAPPSSVPSAPPSSDPSLTLAPSSPPSSQPSREDPNAPTFSPSSSPSMAPSSVPSMGPTARDPANDPTLSPSSSPSSGPSGSPSTVPSSGPVAPTISPSTSPSVVLSGVPSTFPSTSASPSSLMSAFPSLFTEPVPTSHPTTVAPDEDDDDGKGKGKGSESKSSKSKGGKGASKSSKGGKGSSKNSKSGEGKGGNDDDDDDDDDDDNDSSKGGKGKGGGGDDDDGDSRSRRQYRRLRYASRYFQLV